MKEIIELLQIIVALIQSIKTADKRWLTPKELELKYSLVEDTMSKYRMKKQVPFSKLGTKLIRYDSHKIDAWLEEHNVDMLVKENALDLTKKLATDDKKLSAIEMFVKDSFIDIWDKTAANGYKWKDNPLVYSYEFCKTKV